MLLSEKVGKKHDSKIFFWIKQMIIWTVGPQILRILHVPRVHHKPNLMIIFDSSECIFLNQSTLLCKWYNHLRQGNKVTIFFLILLSQCQNHMGFFDCIIQLLKIKTNYKIIPLGNKGQEDLFLLVFYAKSQCSCQKSKLSSRCWRCTMKHITRDST